MDFCMTLASQVMLDELMKKAEGGSPENVVLSPVSITMALNLLASGSAGKTSDQLLEILGSKDAEDLNSKSSTMMSLFAPSSDGSESSDCDSGISPMSSMSSKPQQKGPVFNFVNALWVDHRFPLVPSFKEFTNTIYKAHVENVDLDREAEKVKRQVNSWAEKATKGLIKEIVPRETELEPPLCLANALYFKGDWESQFYGSSTIHEDFHLLNGETAVVPFMTKYGVHFSYGEFVDFKVLRLPYQRGPDMNKQFSMYIFLPNARYGLENLIKKFESDPKMLQSKMLNLNSGELSQVWIPKMKFSHGFKAIELMKAKGLTLPFDRNEADFSRMVRTPDGVTVYVNIILHKAFVEVNEEGTEAAAVTFVGTALGCSGAVMTPPKPSFVAEHPFMFMIVEDFSKLVLFTGAVVNPLLE